MTENTGTRLGDAFGAHSQSERTAGGTSTWATAKEVAHGRRTMDPGATTRGFTGWQKFCVPAPTPDVIEGCSVFLLHGANAIVVEFQSGGLVGAWHQIVTRMRSCFNFEIVRHWKRRTDKAAMLKALVRKHAKIPQPQV